MDATKILDRLKANRKILISKDDDLLLELKEELGSSSRQEIVLWALLLVEQALDDRDEETQKMLRLCRLWAQGKVKMPEAKRAILRIHQLAKESHDAYQEAYYHGLAQGCSCVHTVKHALGLPLYHLSATIFKNNDVKLDKLQQQVEGYLDLLREIKQKELVKMESWSKFLNQEKINHR